MKKPLHHSPLEKRKQFTILRIAFFRNDYLRLSYCNYLCKTAQVEWLLFLTSPEITFNTTYPKHHCRAASQTESWDQMSKACCNSAAETRDTIKLLELGVCSQKSLWPPKPVWKLGGPSTVLQCDPPCFWQSTLKALLQFLRHLWWDGKGGGNNPAHNSCPTIPTQRLPSGAGMTQRTSSDQETGLA